MMITAEYFGILPLFQVIWFQQAGIHRQMLSNRLSLWRLQCLWLDCRLLSRVGCLCQGERFFTIFRRWQPRYRSRLQSQADRSFTASVDPRRGKIVMETFYWVFTPAFFGLDGLVFRIFIPGLFSSVLAALLRTPGKDQPCHIYHTFNRKLDIKLVGARVCSTVPAAYWLLIGCGELPFFRFLLSTFPNLLILLLSFSVRLLEFLDRCRITVFDVFGLLAGCFGGPEDHLHS